MLNTYVNHRDAMTVIIADLRNGRIIEAIKHHRALYGTGLKESKDAVETIRDAIGLMPRNADVRVFSRVIGANGYTALAADDLLDANRIAANIVASREETLVVRVLSKTVVAKTMGAA
jgi:L-lactate utilization protein LutB